MKSPPSSLLQSSSNPFELPKPTKTPIPNQPWEGFCLRNKKITIEDPKKVKVVNPNPHSTICNLEPKPSFVLDMPDPQSHPVHSPVICPSPDDPPQDVDISHLRASTSTTTNLNETCSLDTSCDHLLLLDSLSLSSELQDASSVESVEIEFVPDFEEPLEVGVTSFHQQMFSVYNMTMICSYSIKRLILHLAISTIRTLMSVKSSQDDFLIHATDLSHNFCTTPIHGTTQL